MICTCAERRALEEGWARCPACATLCSSSSRGSRRHRQYQVHRWRTPHCHGAAARMGVPASDPVNSGAGESVGPQLAS